MNEIDPERDERTLSGRHILIVEDDNDAREMLCILLQLQGAQVYPTSSASQAMAMLQGITPDLIISDINLPGGDGIRLLAEIRALPDENRSRVPALALSGFARDSDRADALAAGFDMLAKKPIDTTKLVNLVAWMLTTMATDPGARIPSKLFPLQRDPTKVQPQQGWGWNALGTPEGDASPPQR